MENSLKQHSMTRFHQCVYCVRRAVVDRLGQRNLPLIRVWYHPIVNGKVIKAVLSVRYDVDRAITNMPMIWALERKYGATSTAHLRAFGPFYGRREIRALASLSQSKRIELALHGEFVANAARYGGQLQAALAEKKHLEHITGMSVQGVSIHGGELVSNWTKDTRDIIESAGFLYDTTFWAGHFPFRRLTQNGRLEKTYRLYVGIRDIEVPYSDHYAENLYNEAMHKIELVAQQNGVLVMMMHPEYFGYFTYLFKPTNLIKIFRFLPVYLARVLSTRRSDVHSNPKRAVRISNETGLSRGETK
jgi:hypothetical protein